MDRKLIALDRIVISLPDEVKAWDETRLESIEAIRNFADECEQLWQVTQSVLRRNRGRIRGSNLVGGQDEDDNNEIRGTVTNETTPLISAVAKALSGWMMGPFSGTAQAVAGAVASVKSVGTDRPTAPATTGASAKSVGTDRPTAPATTGASAKSVGTDRPTAPATTGASAKSVGTDRPTGSMKVTESKNWPKLNSIVKKDSYMTAMLRDRLCQFKDIVKWLNQNMQSRHILLQLRDDKLKINENTKVILLKMIAGVPVTPIEWMFKGISLMVAAIKQMEVGTKFQNEPEVANGMKKIAETLEVEMKYATQHILKTFRESGDSKMKQIQIEAEKLLLQMTAFPDEDVTSFETEETKEALIDTNGGQIHLNNVSLIVPDHALDKSVCISMTVNVNSHLRRKQIKLAGLEKFMSSKLHLQLKPHGLQFHEPVEIQLRIMDLGDNDTLLVLHQGVEKGFPTLWTDITDKSSPIVREDYVSLTFNHFSYIEIFTIYLPFALVGLAAYYKSFVQGLLNGRKDACNFDVYYKSADGFLLIYIETEHPDDNAHRHKISSEFEHIGRSSSKYPLFDKENLLFFFDTSSESQAAFSLELEQCKKKWQKVKVPLSARSIEELPSYIDIRRRLPAPHLPELIKEEKLCEIRLLKSQEKMLEIKKEGASYINEILNQLSQHKIISRNEERKLSKVINNTSQPNVRLDINVTESTGATAQADDSMKAEYFKSVSRRDPHSSSVFRHQFLGQSGLSLNEIMDDKLKRLEKYVKIGRSTRDKYITQCYEMLVGHMRTKKLLTRLVARDVIDLEEKNAITGSGTGEKIEERQSEELVDIIRRLDNEKYLIFLQVLADVQENLVQLLTEGKWHPPTC